MFSLANTDRRMIDFTGVAVNEQNVVIIFPNTFSRREISVGGIISLSGSEKSSGDEGSGDCGAR